MSGWRMAGIALAAAAALGGAVVLTLRSDWFHNQVRAKLVSELEAATGGKVEISGFEFQWTRLEAEARGLVLHGTERADRAPLLRVELIRLALGPGSLLRRRLHVRALRLERPEAHIYVAADGSTNLPHPRAAGKGATAEDLLKLRIGRAEIVSGHVEVADRELDFDARVQGLATDLRYARMPDRYETRIAIESIESPDLPPGLGFEVNLVLEAARLRATGLELRAGRSWIKADGVLENFAHPTSSGSYSTEFRVSDLPKGSLRAGEFHVAGDWRWSPGTWRATAMTHAVGMVFMIFKRPAAPISTEGTCEIGPGGVTCPRLRGVLLGGKLAGSGAWRDYKRLEIGGEVSGVEVQRLRYMFAVLPAAWQARASGDVRMNAAWAGGDLGSTVLAGKLHATPAEGSWGLDGVVDFEWHDDGDTLRFGPSTLDTAATHAGFEGVLDQRMSVKLRATDAAELQDTLRKGLQRDDVTVPFRLDHGSIEASGTLIGALDRPTVDGTLRVAGAVYQDVRCDEFEAAGMLAPDRLDLHSVQVKQGTSTSSGTVHASLDQWRLTGASRLDASVALRHADLAALSRTLKLASPVGGAADARLRVQGTYDRPEATVRLDAPEILWRGEKFERVHGQVQFHNDGREVVTVDLAADDAHVTGKGNYDHPSGTWSDGRLEFQLGVAKLALNRLENLMAVQPGLDGTLQADLEGSVLVKRGEARPERLAGRVAAQQLTLGGAPLGSMEAQLRPDGNGTQCDIAAQLEDVRVTGQARLDFGGDELLEGRLDVPRLPFHLLRRIARGSAAEPPADALPVRGFAAGQVQWRVALAKPDDFKVSASVTSLEIWPRGDQILDTQINPGDLTLRNSGVIRLAADRGGVRIEAAKFTARETDLTLAGGYAFDSRAPWDLHLTGSVNLALAGTFRPDLKSAGTARLDATLRGPADDPQLAGRMTIANASLFLKDVPNGIEDANGTIYFERNRANIEKITGHTGSGTFELAGFVAFEPDITFRLQARAANVRLRYPEGVSTLLDGDLTLVGSPARSLLSGTLTVARSGFTSKTDLGSIVAQSGTPVPLIATDSEFLRNVQFDVRLRTTPNATLVSQYTQEVQTEADLRLRGSLIKPVVLGRLLVHHGIVQFFGNRYTISRGELLFYSTATLAPSLDLDLETRVRGVTVYINIAGPLSRLKVNYRSEPPLQPAEILALLTVGRTPAAQSTALPTAPGTGNPALTENSTNSLLGGALSGAVSARVERFFGASRIKIDPQVTGVDNVPQARVTVEQSISRNVTMTFVSNLRQAQQQVVQFEWNLNPEWSLIAVRDENGIFGADLLFKKRFK